MVKRRVVLRGDLQRVMKCVIFYSNGLYYEKAISLEILSATFANLH